MRLGTCTFAFSETAYFGLSQNPKIRTVPYRHSRPKRLSEASYNRCPTCLFFLHVSQYRLLHSCLSILLSILQVAQHRLRLQTDFFFVVLCLWLSKHAWLLKGLHSEQCIRTAEKGPGDRSIQSLHVWLQMCYVTYDRFFTRFTHKPLRHTPVIFVIT